MAGHSARILPPLRPGRPADAALVARRGRATATEMRAIGGVPCAIIEAAPSRARIVHFHGGGYRMGSVAGWRGFGERLSQAARATVVLPDYALAPELPFPAAVHDAVAVVSALGAKAGSPIILSGDSAGGGLALAAASILAPDIAIAGLILLSPWLDLTLSAASFERCEGSDPLFSRAAASASAADYLQGVDPADPLASPTFGDLRALSPTLVMASASEVLCDDSLGLAMKLAQAGRRATLVIEPAERHVWPVLDPDRPATARAMDQIGLFIGALTAADGGESSVA